MKNPQRVLLDLLSSCGLSDKILPTLTAHELAEVYVDSAFLESAIQFLKDENWLQSKKSQAPIDFKKFLQNIFHLELKHISYLLSHFEGLTLKDLKTTLQRSLQIEMNVIQIIHSRSDSEQKQFATKSLEMMSDLFRFEAELQGLNKAKGTHTGLSLYRTFDRLDEVFDLNYQADHGMKVDLQGGERLYEGAGIGVQSGYSTILTALSQLNISNGARLIDLGSGYGRVGLVMGLLRPDIDFIGYEYVPHRVQISSQTTKRMGMEGHVQFFTQDLSLQEFQIPEAEVYYMYDPFSQETYGHVLSQLIAISKKQKIVIVTKGNARGWLVDVARREGWAEPQEFDSGNLCLFFSR